MQRIIFKQCEKKHFRLKFDFFSVTMINNCYFYFLGLEVIYNFFELAGYTIVKWYPNK